MDSAADDLMTASIGRSPRNDPDPPGPHQADFHGLPLDNATKPASTEAQLRQLAALATRTCTCTCTCPCPCACTCACSKTLEGVEVRTGQIRVTPFPLQNPLLYQFNSQSHGTMNQLSEHTRKRRTQQSGRHSARMHTKRNARYKRRRFGVFMLHPSQHQLIHGYVKSTACQRTEIRKCTGRRAQLSTASGHIPHPTPSQRHRAGSSSEP
jgi:hypothetical protein